MAVVVLGEIKAGFIVHFTTLFSLGTILLCYFLAVAYKHVPLWLPMISDCAIKQPEMFPFRFGVVTSSLLLALGSLLIFVAAVPRSILALTFGVLGSLCLGVVGVVNEVEASKVHSSEQPHLFLDIFCIIIGMFSLSLLQYWQ